MSIREELAERLNVDLTPPSEESAIAQLEQRRQALAPEALAGDTDAIQELDAVEGEIARAHREAELAELAHAELDARTRQAKAEQAERERSQWAEEKAALEATRDQRLSKVERTLTALVNEIAAVRNDDVAISVLGQSIDPGWHAPLTMPLIEDRLARRLRDVGVRPDAGLLIGRMGMEPLGRAESAPRARTRTREKPAGVAEDGRG